MEVSELPKIVLMFVLIGMLLGVGALTLDKFGAQTWGSKTELVQNESLGAVTNSTYTVFQHNGTAGFNTKCALIAVYNVTTATNVLLLSGNYSFLTNCSLMTMGKLGGFENNSLYVNYTYTFEDNNTAATTAVSASSGNLTGLATNWLPLTITILALVIIVGLVIRGFGAAAERK